MSRETPEIEEAVEAWARARLEALAAEAAEVASEFYLRAAQQRDQRPREEWGRLGVRVRPVRAARAAPGAFSIEWFTRRWVNRTGGRARTFTTYLRRGNGDRYARSTLRAVAQPWELALADTLEERFAEIRRLARGVSRVRTAFRQHAKLERALEEAAAERSRVPGEPGAAASPGLYSGQERISRGEVRARQDRSAGPSRDTPKTGVRSA